jgi:hypothetical protein
MKELLMYLGISIAGFLVCLVILSFLFRYQSRKRKRTEKYVVVQVRVPKENEKFGPIVAEQVFSTLHGIQAKFSFWQKLKGYSSDHVSFELTNVDRVIKFNAAFPERLRNLVEGQIYAQYADVEISDCVDYSFEPKYRENAVGVELELVEADIFPVRRYSQFEDKINKIIVDTIAGITSSLVKLNSNEDQAWIQIVVSPLPNKWRIIFTKCVKILNKGIFANIDFLTKAYAKAFITRNLWPKVVFFPVYAVFWIQGFLAFAGVHLDEGGGHSRDVDEQVVRMHEKEKSMDAAIDKVGRLMFETKIRIVYVPKEKNVEKAKVKLHEIVGSFKQFNFPHLNGFEIDKFVEGRKAVEVFHERSLEGSFVLNNEELATIYHLPTIMVKTPNIYWVSSKKLEPPTDLPGEEEDGERTTILGQANFRDNKKIFGIKPVDRRRHVYIIGKTGMGKSTLLENMIFSDIEAGKGVGVIDPHGDLAEAVLNFIPAKRINDVILIDPADQEYAVAFNMLENVNPALNSIVCSGLVGIFKKIYADSWGPRLEHILRNTILALLEYPGTTMLGITRMLVDSDFRWKIVKKVQDPVVKSFWLDEFAKMSDKFLVEAVSPIQNKVGQFLSSPTIRNIVGQPKSSVNFRFAMDKGKIVIINLSKGKIGEDNSALLGAMFITKFQLDAMSRAEVPEKDRKDFYLYVDEFQNFATEAFATILSEARKYKLNLTMANQYIAQMPEEVRDAVFGNVGSTLAFQVGFDDAEYLSQQFGEEILPPDLVSLSKYTAYMRLLIDGMPSKTFSLATLPPPKAERIEENIAKVIKVSRERYAEKTSVIHDKITRWSRNKDNREDGEEDGDAPKREFKPKYKNK